MTYSFEMDGYTFVINFDLKMLSTFNGVGWTGDRELKMSPSGKQNWDAFDKLFWSEQARSKIEHIIRLKAFL